MQSFNQKMLTFQYHIFFLPIYKNEKKCGGIFHELYTAEISGITFKPG